MKYEEQWFFMGTILAHIFLLTIKGDKILQLPGQPEVSFQQYSGYITVDEKQGKALFYYFVQAEVDPDSKPLVLWLNGGPGCSSVGIGAFVEHGPFRPTIDDGLVRNNYSWNKIANMLYLESPAGVGYSYSMDKNFYSFIDDEMTARDNLEFLHRWFHIFPNYKDKDLFITGESYAGHYVPQLAELIVRSKSNFKLRGIAIGNPLLDFESNMNPVGEFMWSHGMISDSTFELLNSVCSFARFRRENQRGSLSDDCSVVIIQLEAEVSRFINPEGINLDVCLPNNTNAGGPSQQYHRLGIFNQLDYPRKLDTCIEAQTVAYLNRKDVQKALHARLVGVSEWTVCSEVIKYDMLNREAPTVHLLGSLVNSGIRILIYCGDQDAVLPLTRTRSLVSGLAKHMKLTTTTAYKVWFEEKQVGGWAQVYSNNLTYATIRGASHQAAFSQPEKSLVLFRAFVQGKPLPRGPFVKD